jgi:hypothetical protein|tara:strand:- start:505 stop:726 length:222 start_codon:yes stop_codon:yes gene_type:complete
VASEAREIVVVKAAWTAAKIRKKVASELSKVESNPLSTVAEARNPLSNSLSIPLSNPLSNPLSTMQPKAAAWW